MQIKSYLSISYLLGFVNMSLILSELVAAFAIHPSIKICESIAAAAARPARGQSVRANWPSAYLAISIFKILYMGAHFYGWGSAWYIWGLTNLELEPICSKITKQRGRTPEELVGRLTSYLTKVFLNANLHSQIARALGAEVNYFENLTVRKSREY